MRNQKLKEAKESEMKGAIRSAMERYRQIEAKFAFMEQLQELLAPELPNVDEIVDNYSIWKIEDGYQLYTYSTSMKAKQETAELLMACVEVFGEGSRAPNDSQKILYTWKEAVNGEAFQIEVSPTVAGCKLVAKTTFVPEKTEVIPAHEDTTYEIDCNGGGAS